MIWSVCTNGSCTNSSVCMRIICAKWKVRSFRFRMLTMPREIKSNSSSEKRLLPEVYLIIKLTGLRMRSMGTKTKWLNLMLSQPPKSSLSKTKSKKKTNKLFTWNNFTETWSPIPTVKFAHWKNCFLKRRLNSKNSKSHQDKLNRQPSKKRTTSKTKSKSWEKP